jgi:5-methylthioadenosine/S-adenosylhomocysteine deaminase
MVDVLIEKGWLIPVDGTAACSRGWLATSRGVVSAIGVGTTPDGMRQSADRVIDASGCVVTPGFVNAHTHLSQTMMRGLASERPLSEWLAMAIQPLQAAMTPRDMRLAALLGLVENLRSGVTAVIQHHKITQSRDHVEAALDAAQSLGMRMVLARGWRDTGARGERPETIEEEITYLYRHWHGRAAGRIQVAAGPMEPRRCSAQTMARILRLTRGWGLKTHIHVAETSSEVAEFARETGSDQIHWLESLGALGPDIQLVHCVHVSNPGLDLIARRGANVVHCPVSNMRLASGIAPIGKMLERGIPVCLGTDGPASNDTQDLLETMKVASLLSKVATGDAASLSPGVVLQMATTVAARAAGLVNVGRLVVGADADIAVISLNSPGAMPVHRPDNALVYSASGAVVHTVLVAGRAVLDAGRVTVLDEAALIRECQQAADNLLVRAGLSESAALSQPAMGAFAA